jgi:hypothetical protein
VASVDGIVVAASVTVVAGEVTSAVVVASVDGIVVAASVTVVAREVTSAVVVASVDGIVVAASGTVVAGEVTSAVVVVSTPTQNFGSASSSTHSLRDGSASMKLQMVRLQTEHLKYL